MTREEVQEQFGANAAAYAGSVVHAKGASLGRLVDLAKPAEDWIALDVATGAGHTAFAFAPLVAEVVAADVTAQMLAQARRLARERNHANVLLETADAADLPHAEETFDLVTCRIAPHHFADIARFVSEAARVLRPGGLLAVADNIVPPGPIGDYVNAFERLRDPSHRRCWSLEEWRASFADAGLRLMHTETLAKRLDFEFWAGRHGAQMQAYLRALLLQAGRGATAFLQPEMNGSGLRFRLVEGILIGRKTGRS